MKIGIYSPFSPTFGGGERYCLTIAEILSQDNEVDFISQFNYDLQEFSEAFNLDLKKVKFFKKSGAGQFFSPQIKKKYDLFICLSNHTIPPVFSWGRKGILIIQFPFPYNQDKIPDKIQVLLKKFKYTSYDLVICYSKFTQEWIRRLDSSNTEVIVLSPPIDVSYFISAAKKENKILSVGRFFRGDHDKKYPQIITAFKGMLDKAISGWSCHIAGGVSDPKYFEKIKKQTLKNQIFLHPNISAEGLKILYGQAKIFWHATGLFNDEDRTPWKSEHFGMTVLEAMSAGCVPIVANRGALPEFVKHGKNGFLFNNLDELETWTRKLINNDNLRKKMSGEGVGVARGFAKKIFKRKLLKIVEELMK